MDQSRAATTRQQADWESLLAGKQQHGFFALSGSSGMLKTRVHQLLTTYTSRGAWTRHLLSSGCPPFLVPAYLPLQLVAPPTSIRLDAFTVFTGDKMLDYTPSLMAQQLRQQAPRHGSGVVLLECLTTLAAGEQTFLQQLLAMGMARRVPVILAIHQPDNPPNPIDTPHELLCVLYLCGGRVHLAVWQACTTTPFVDTGRPPDSAWITVHGQGTDTVLTYAHQYAAAVARQCYLALRPDARQQLAQRVLAVLPHDGAYPFLSIAAETQHLATLQATYSTSALLLARQSDGATQRYFRTVTRQARIVGDDQLAALARANLLATLLQMPRMTPVRFATWLQQLNLHDLDRRFQKALWFELGQRLMRSADAQNWDQASRCFAACRACVAVMPQLTPTERQMHIASICNGEAFVALKRHDMEQALQLEQTALAGLRDLLQHPDVGAQYVLLSTHVAMLQVRRGALTQALHQYRHTMEVATAAPSYESRLYVAPPFAELLMQVKQFREAIAVLEPLLLSMERRARTVAPPHARLLLRAHLTLAQAYTAQGDLRQASRCYWMLLRRSEHLTPSLVRGIVRNLQLCRHPLASRSHHRLARVLREQEALVNDVAQARQVLAATPHAHQQNSIQLSHREA